MDKTIEKINDGSDIVVNGYNKIETWNSENIKELSEIYYQEPVQNYQFGQIQGGLQTDGPCKGY
jgi:hypothetical protein